MKKSPFILLVIFSLFISSCTDQVAVDTNSVRQEVQTMFDAYVQEVNEQGIERIHRYFSDAEEFYWVEDGALQYPDKATLIEGVQAFYPSISSVELQVSKSNISVIDNHLATLYVQYTQEVKLKSGFQFTLDGAMTILTRKEGEFWRFFQGHSSIKKPRDGG